MHAGVSGGVATAHDREVCEIPEWKRLLIMKRRTGAGGDEHPAANGARNGDEGFPGKFPRPCEAPAPKTVTIGNINVALRSVKPGSAPQAGAGPRRPERAPGAAEPAEEDLQYGPGIVDRLRARFLSLGAQKGPRAPAVRRFSSLENLPGSQYRVGAARGALRPNGLRPGSCYGNGVVKKAQSMETLISSGPAPEAFAAFRRPASARYVGGVKARIMAKGAAPPVSAFADENEEPGDEGAPPSPRLFAKAPSRPRWEHPRPNSINEDELPKPDTVKHVKKIFESPGAAAPEKPAGPPLRFRKNSGSTPAVGIVCGDGSAIARPPQEPPGPEANPSAKEPERASVNTNNCSTSTDIPPPPAQTGEDESPLPEEPPRTDFHPEISRDPALGAGLSPADDRGDSADDDPRSTSSAVSSPSEEEEEEEAEEHPGTPPEEPEPPGPIAREPFPLEGRASPPSPLSQAAVSGAEPPQDAALPPAAASPEEEMVVASGVSAGPPPPRRGGAAWQKPPAQATSVVFDFRGKDVKPHIQLQPAPFGCRPARAPPPKQARGAVNGDAAPLPVPRDYEREEEEEWDEMDVGADLPPVSGIVFSGENVKVGRGAFLERRNKKLTIQFDDCATSTFEYPSENSSPSPMDENDSEFDSASSIGSAANCRVGLSNYTPQVLGSDNDFQLGVSQPNHRPNLPSPKSQVSEDVPALDVIPANPENTGGWSATETVDILF